jgi:hypothetical protein
MHIGAPFYMIQFEVLVVSRCDGYLFSCVHLFFFRSNKGCAEVSNLQQSDASVDVY